jgi:hypothetical protein
MIRTIVRMTVAGLFLQVATLAAYAQTIKVEIPFAFIAGKTELPAGSYELSVNNSNSTVLAVRSMAKGGQSLQVHVLTRVSARPDSPSIYFDKTEDKAYLAEVYFPGTDGVHLQGAPGKHTHTKVAAK